MTEQHPVVFADAITSVKLANGVVRITLGSVDAENKLQTSGTLILPLNQFHGMVRNLANAVNDLIAKARKAQGAQAGDSGGETSADAEQAIDPNAPPIQH